jgi:ribosomal subunit interface protein
MDIRVSGHQVATGDALRTHVDTRMQGIANKYFARAIGANVTLGKGPHDNGFSCDIVAHVMHGLILKGSAFAMEAHPAFDAAAEKIERQLRRYMRRLKAHNGPAAPAEPTPGVVLDNARYTVFEADETDEEVNDNPVVVAETRVDVPDATVSDAVMEPGHSTWFIGAATGRSVGSSPCVTDKSQKRGASTRHHPDHP